MPVLVGNGIADVMVPAEHSFAIAQKAPRAKLLLYPDAGHAFLFQYAEDFRAEVLRFTANVGPEARVDGYGSVDRGSGGSTT
jgi:pimeloyl-ACP methyl ester carboxylesterase